MLSPQQHKPAATFIRLACLTAALTACAPKDFRPAAVGSVAIKQGSTAILKIHVERDEALKGPIAVSVKNLPDGVTASTGTIPEGKTDAELTLIATASAPMSPTATGATSSSSSAAAPQPTVTFSVDKTAHDVPLALTVRPLSGSADKAFGKDGTVRMKMGVYLKRDHANTIALTSDEKILLGGQKDDHFAVYRLRPDGQPDASFGKQGLAVAAGAPGTIEKLLVDADGSFVALGADQYEGSGVMLAKFTKDGQLDPAFGKNGSVNYKFSGFAYHGVSDAVRQSDGKMVIVGAIGNERGGSGGMSDGKSLLARFNPDGGVDRSFGGGGRVIGAPQEFGYADDVELGPNDTLVVVGSTYNHWGDTWGSNVFYLARYLNDGSADGSFGNNGFVTYTERHQDGSDGKADAYGVGVNVLPDGKVLTLANTTTANADMGDWRNRMRVAQYLPDGARDIDFGEDGEVSYDFGHSALASGLTRAPDGYFLTATVTPEESATSAPSLVKLSKDGTLDESFNYDGRVGTGTLDIPLNAVLLKNGQVLSGATLSPFFQDFDDNEDAAKVNVELVKINP